MRGRGLLAMLVPAAAACVLHCGGTSTAHATQAQQPRTTTTTTCRFAPSSASTLCNQETTVVRVGPCTGPGERESSEDHVASARTYRGNAVRPGLDGKTVEGGYAAAVRPGSELVYDSGPHAYGTGLVVDDPSCG
jgi:hypothetical protein